MKNIDIEDYSKYGQFYADEMPELMLKYFKASNCKNFLDFGCGDGALLYALDQKGYFNDKNVYAIDLSKNRIELAKKINKDFICFVDDACNIKNIKENSVDFLASIQLIEHVENDKKMIGEIEKLLVHSGTAYIATVFKKWYGWYFYRCNGKWALDPSHVREYAKDSRLLDILKKYNFDILENKKTLIYRPMADFILKRFGFKKNIFAGSRFFRAMRIFKIPVPGYYNWEIICRKK
jgi:2-polyprenyl-3-methyl-5-hydroxy-6-metoxy-1,4-benzoquinol methylase